MAVRYVSPSLMSDYRQKLLVFAKGSPSLECISAHYLPDRTGNCELTGAKEQEEVFILANRAGGTLKVCQHGMQVVANVLDIVGADEWYQRLKDQKKAYKERLAQDAAKREEERKAASKTVVLRKKNPSTVIKSSH